MKIRWSVILLALAAVATATAAQRGPERPDEAFTVYVSSNLEATENEDYPPEKVTKEVKKRIKKRKKWFVVAKSPEKAELFVEVVRHTVDEQMRHKLVSRVDVTGASKNWVTETWTQERHYLEARVDAFGRQKLIQGEDTRESGGNLKRAAADLAENLEKYCRESYEELSRLRREKR